MGARTTADEVLRRVLRRRVSGVAAGTILAALLVASYVASYLLGGAEGFEPLWVLVPITYAAWRFGPRATAITIVFSAVLIGPLLPADTAAGRAQQFTDWGSRTFFLVMIGALLAYLFGQYGRTVELVERERDAALAKAQVREDAADLRRAMASGELHLHYQPILRASDAEIVAVEALVRWNHPKLGPVSPAQFIPLAEESGAITDLDAWVAETAAREVKGWQALQPVRLGLNLSSVTLSDANAVGAIEAALVRSGMDLRMVDIEMTETAAGDGTIATESLSRLATRGMRLSLDDFGMGYAVLERLRAFPFSTVKIDRSFISRVDGVDGPVVEAITRMAHSMGLEVLAEGVEEFEQLEKLRALGCDLVQGFLLSRPLPADQLRALLRTRSGLVASRMDNVQPVLDQVQRMTGLTAAYMTSINWEDGTQAIVAVSGRQQQMITKGLSVAWSDSLCRRALEGGPNLTSDVPRAYPDSAAARELGIQTYVSVPIERDGRVVGTLCAISRDRVDLAPQTVQLMAGLAESVVMPVIEPPVVFSVRQA